MTIDATKDVTTNHARGLALPESLVVESDQFVIVLSMLLMFFNGYRKVTTRVITNVYALGHANLSSMYRPVGI